MRILVKALTIVSPVGDRCNSHAILESLSAIKLQSLERGETTITPAPNGSPLLVDVLFLCPHLGYSNLVMCFVSSDVATGDAAQFSTQVASSAPIDRDDDIAKVGGYVILERDIEFLVDGLRTRTAVLEEEDGILALLVEVRWTTLDDVEFEAIYINCLVVEGR